MNVFLEKIQNFERRLCLIGDFIIRFYYYYFTSCLLPSGATIRIVYGSWGDDGHYDSPRPLIFPADSLFPRNCGSALVRCSRMTDLMRCTDDW